MATRNAYSAFDPVTKTRVLYKYFRAREGPRAFDPDSPFDVFRRLMWHAVDIVGRLEYDNSLEEEVSRLVAFVSRPVLPSPMQRVGLGVHYDISIEGQRFVYLENGKLEHGYEVVCDLARAYKLGRIIVEPRSKSILVPGTEYYTDEYVGGCDISGEERRFRHAAAWVVPKLQFCSSRVLADLIPCYKPGK